ncbi:MAG: hypothetical protein WDZ85_00740 [Candidatus Paceibacterota bacterium]
MTTTLEVLSFEYSDEDVALFQNDQQRHWESIERYYPLLRLRCLDEIPTPIETSQREWITTRSNRLLTTSIMRLLYLAESFRDACLKFNGPATAIHAKAMIEPVLHISNIAWILEHHNADFEQIRREFDQMAFGRRDGGGLTTRARISNRQLYTRADELMQRLGNGAENTPDINVFETLYKEANATGHHNFEGRDILIGVTDKNDVWRPKDRKEWFIFMSSNIFQFFLHTSTVLSMSHIFVGMIDHYLNQLPERLSGTENAN